MKSGFALDHVMIIYSQAGHTESYQFRDRRLPRWYSKFDRTALNHRPYFWAWVVQLSPLYHGVALVRGASFGEWSWAYVGHLSVLVAMGIVGLAVTARRIERLLLP